MKKKIVTFIILLLAHCKAYGIDCDKHKIYCKIVELQPKIDKQFAMKVSNKIFRKAQKYNIDPMLSVAIINQESSFRNINTYIVNKSTNYECNEEGCQKTVIEQHDVLDMTLTQINIKTALDYQFDVDRLFKLDLDYALECHYKVLSDKIKLCEHLGDEAWSCYHSKTEDLREKYVDLVSRYL